MTLRHLFLIPALLCATTVFGQTARTAHANIVNAEGIQIGIATIAASPMGVTIMLKVSQLTPGVHGIHIHTVGKCEGPAFATAGGHLNPDMKMHGKDNPNGPHAGDLLNFSVDANGTADTTLQTDHVTLGEGPNGLFHAGGTALVIHAVADDYKTDPTGNSGSRIACGVIQK